jgi:hypothetical protein
MPYTAATVWKIRLMLFFSNHGSVLRSPPIQIAETCFYFRELEFGGAALIPLVVF